MKSLTILFSAIIFLASCSKEVTVPAPAPAPHHHSPRLQADTAKTIKADTLLKKLDIPLTVTE